MKATNVENISRFQNAHGVDAKNLYTTKNAEVIFVNLKLGQSLKKHTTPVDVFFYILEGKARLKLEMKARYIY